MVFDLGLSDKRLTAKPLAETNQSSQLSSQQAINQASSWASYRATELSS